MQRSLQSVDKRKKECLFEERELFSHTIFCVHQFSMSRSRTQAPFEHISDFDRGRIIAYTDCRVCSQEFDHCIGRNQVIVMRIWNWWIQKGKTDRIGVI